MKISDEYKKNNLIRVASEGTAIMKAAGFEAYMVGGAVRDICMGRPIHDVDITASAMPEETIGAFQGCQVLETGIRHGTVTVMFPDGDEKVPLEITTYRVDGEYTDSRHPDKVEFTRSLEEDLKRRDFTMNAMAMDLQTGDIVDIFGGRADIENGVIRAVGDPDKRFREDALRIMRALRFSAALGMAIESETEAAMFRNRELLKNISVERILTELRKLVTGINGGDVIRKYVDIIGVVIPELLPMKGFDQRNPHHKFDVLEHCIRAMEAVDSNEAYMKLAALLHDVGKPQTFFIGEDGLGHMYGHAEAGRKMAEDIMNRLRTDNEMKQRVCDLVRYHDLPFEENARVLKRWMNRYGVQTVFDVIEIKKADIKATGLPYADSIEMMDRIKALANGILEEEQCFSLKDLEIGGRDLIGIGVKPGKHIGRVLETLLDEVIEGDLPNDKEILLGKAREMLELG